MNGNRSRKTVADLSMRGGGYFAQSLRDFKIFDEL